MYMFLSVRDNYADQFDCFGMQIMSLQQWELYKSAVLSITKEVTIQFGSDEGISYPNGKEFLELITALPITEEEVKIFSKFIPSISSYRGVGSLGNFDCILENYSDYDIDTGEFFTTPEIDNYYNTLWPVEAE